MTISFTKHSPVIDVDLKWPQLLSDNIRTYIFNKK